MAAAAAVLQQNLFSEAGLSLEGYSVFLAGQSAEKADSILCIATGFFPEARAGYLEYSDGVVGCLSEDHSSPFFFDSRRDRRTNGRSVGRSRRWVGL